MSVITGCPQYGLSTIERSDNKTKLILWRKIRCYECYITIGGERRKSCEASDSNKHRFPRYFLMTLKNLHMIFDNTLLFPKSTCICIFYTLEMLSRSVILLKSCFKFNKKIIKTFFSSFQKSVTKD